MSAPAVPGRRFAQVLEQVRAIVAAPVEGCSAGELAEDMRDGRAVIDLMEMDSARCLRAFEAKGGPRAAGATSTVAWARSALHLSGGQAQERVVLGRQLEAGMLPLTEAAVEAREIGFSHATVLARTASEVGGSAMAAGEAALVDRARSVDPAQLREEARSFRHTVDPTGALRAAQVAYRRRMLDLTTTDDGMTRIEGRLDAEGGAMLRSALERFLKPMRGDTRTPRQRRADALKEMARRLVHGGDRVGSPGRLPQLIVTVPVATLRGEPGSPAAQLGDGSMVPAETARRLACHAEVKVVRMDAKGIPLDACRTRRSPTPTQWAALVARDGGCRWPDPQPCDRSADWCVVHHHDSVVFGGPTNVKDMYLLCWDHHTWVHEAGWTLVGEPNGELRAVPPGPDGRPARIDEPGVRKPRVFRARTPVRRSAGRPTGRAPSAMNSATPPSVAWAAPSGTARMPSVPP
jgi:hypothetical protein